MRSCSHLLVLCGCLLFAHLSLAQKEDWLPISQKDLSTRGVPGMPGEPAIQLYFAEHIDDRDQTEFFYHRIKVLNDGGSRYADVEILVPPDASITGLKARTVHPDGGIVDFTGKPFQKVVIKERGLKVMAQAFTMPRVTVGSIIEYKYKIQLPGVYLDNAWTIQHDLYTVKENFLMMPFGGTLEGFEKGHQVAALSSHMPSNLKPRQKNGGYELEVENMPPFEAEGHMPPEDDYKPQVRFFYGGTEIASTDRFWQEAGRQWNEDAELFIGRRREIAEEAARVIGAESDPVGKLRRLYARAQEIRNLTYERERTEQEEQKENLKPNQSAGDVLSHGYGNRDDIGRFFAALARAAGFDVSILRVSDRSEKFFDRGLLSRQQLGSEIALVVENGQELFLDPGTRFCPFGFVRWMHTSSLALQLDKNGGTFIKVPAAGYNQAMVRRSAEMALSPEGALAGTFTATFEGGEALERRLDALATDGTGRKQALEEEAMDWLPLGASVKLLNTEGWEGSDAPLIATFAVELPSYATVAGRRLLVPAYLFHDHDRDAFNHPDRKYPVYFPYAFGESDTVTIQLPPDYSAENLPGQQSSSLSYATYLNATQFDGKRLVTQRVLQVNGIFFRVEIYPEVRDFFRKVQLGDEQRMVFHPGSAFPSSTQSNGSRTETMPSGWGVRP